MRGRVHPTVAACGHRRRDRGCFERRDSRGWRGHGGLCSTDWGKSCSSAGECPHRYVVTCDGTEAKQLPLLFHLHTEACARRMSPHEAIYSKCIATDANTLNSDCEKFKSSTCDCLAKHPKLQDVLSSSGCAFLKHKLDRFMTCPTLAPTSPSPSVASTSTPPATRPASHGSPIAAAKVGALMHDLCARAHARHAHARTH